MTPGRAADLLRAKRPSAKKKKGGRSPFPMREVAVFLFVVLVLAVGAFGYVATAETDAIAHGVTIGPVDVGGRTADEAKTLLREQVAGLTLTFSTEERSVTLTPSAAAGGSGAFAAFGLEDAVDRARAVGRAGGALRSALARLGAAVGGAPIPLPVTLDRGALRRQLEEAFAERIAPAKDARLVVRVNDDGSHAVAVLPEEEGRNIDFDRVLAEAEERLMELGGSEIRVRITRELPTLARADVAPLENGVAAALERAPLTARADEHEWEIDKETLAGWLAAVPTGGGEPKALLGLDGEKVAAFLDAKAPAVARAPKDAVFEMKDGKVATFEPAIDGRELDIDASIGAIGRAVFQPGGPGADGAPVDLVIAVDPPRITTEASNPYGIKEIIGVGETNFRGSPPNRRHNIRVGADALNGLLVKPEEEFSLLAALGEIDAAAGYLQELVIKENRTIPEYGGGLCQIGSTTFRAVLASGLPVTERRNHSYRVPYYERDGDGSYIGPGKDATIYDPAPDFKFRNDTGRHILITTAIDGNRLTFAFWGTRDGRVAEQTDSKVFGIVPPPPKKVIETTDLPPGVEKCTESAHVGSRAVFTYTVTYPDGRVATEDFHSHYKPWQEVCLVGVDPNAIVPDNAGGQPPSSDASGAAGN
jgi:vancomycin resistance protein YoaR